jgi:hypothetical protein
VSGALLLLVLAQPVAPSSLEQLASSVAAQTQAAGASAPLAVALTAPGHPNLQQAFWTVLSPRLSGLGLAPVLLPSSDAETQARARGMRALLRLRLSLDGTLRVSGDVFSTWENVFSGRTQERPRAPAAVVFAEAPLDAATRALAQRASATGLLLVPEPLAQLSVRTAALALGDLDADGRAEVALLTTEAVEVRAADGRLLARRSLEALPRATAPPREAFGTLAICNGLLYVYSASRAAGEVLALQAGALVLHAPLLHPVVACGSPPLEADFVPGAARLAPAGGGWPDVPAGPAAWGLFRRPSGRGLAWLFLLENGTARTAEAPGPWRSVLEVGAGAALADVQGDGTLLLAASSAAAAPAEDVLRLLGLQDGVEHARVTVSGRILQVAAGALEAQGPESLVLGVWQPDGGAEVRLVRGLP